MNNIILFGAPGSGKGTQSNILVKKYNFYHISTGDILRSEIAAMSDLGKKAKELVEAGKLVPDDVVISMVEKYILQNKDKYDGVLFDGFPRTCPQAIALYRMLEKLGIAVSKVICLDVPEEELITRIRIRAQTSNRSDDTNIDIINARIKEYNDKTEPLLDFYKRHKTLYKVSGTGTVDEINKRICDLIENVDV